MQSLMFSREWMKEKQLIKLLMNCLKKLGVFDIVEMGIVNNGYNKPKIEIYMLMRSLLKILKTLKKQDRYL